METYIIRRRSGWADASELEAAADRSRAVAERDFPEDIRWIRSYVVPEPDGRLGTFCVYQASSIDAIRDHANRVGMPADDISPVVDTVVVRPDPSES